MLAVIVVIRWDDNGRTWTVVVVAVAVSNKISWRIHMDSTKKYVPYRPYDSSLTLLRYYCFWSDSLLPEYVYTVVHSIRLLVFRSGIVVVSTVDWRVVVGIVGVVGGGEMVMVRP